MFKTLISTDVLASQGDDSWTIVDCRYDLRDVSWGALQYQQGHIPGAVYASLSHHLSSSPTGTNGRHPLPCVEDIAATVGRLGIGNGKQVVAYDQDSGMFASRLWWMLRYLGHDAVAVLDGGWAKWTSEGRPVQAGEEHRPHTVFTARRRKDMRVLSDQVKASLGDRSLLLVDARSSDRFEGNVEPIDRIAGHIPGAVNHPHKSNVADSGVLLPVERLREQFADTLGGRSTDQVVMYCGSGVTACHNLLAMEHAGFEGGKLYPGSWSEWSADPTRPVETGPARKP